MHGFQSENIIHGQNPDGARDVVILHNGELLLADNFLSNIYIYILNPVFNYF